MKKPCRQRKQLVQMPWVSLEGWAWKVPVAGEGEQGRGRKQVGWWAGLFLQGLMPH